jgi:hypothetical protein
VELKAEGKDGGFPHLLNIVNEGDFREARGDLRTFDTARCQRLKERAITDIHTLSTSVSDAVVVDVVFAVESNLGLCLAFQQL